ncbi:unnamed protein product, partial [Mesorhabditis belari]|uniref:Uncharacterized protein n=1 Tax=Mesorhabditis belari TaxID=2138241 RepID=A0AAF3J5G5_9BILA
MPCGDEYASVQQERRLMEETATAPIADQSVYGLIVFLVIFLLFATLTSGLLVCLTKIWCGFKGRERQCGKLTDKERNEILHSPAFRHSDMSDSEDESAIHNTLHAHTKDICGSRRPSSRSIGGAAIHLSYSHRNSRRPSNRSYIVRGKYSRNTEVKTNRVMDLVSRSMASKSTTFEDLQPNGVVSYAASLSAGEAIAACGQSSVAPLPPPPPPLLLPSHTDFIFSKCLPHPHKTSFFVPVHDPNSVVHV